LLKEKYFVFQKTKFSFTSKFSCGILLIGSRNSIGGNRCGGGGGGKVLAAKISFSVNI
jgi:hypothetical protein